MNKFKIVCTQKQSTTTVNAFGPRVFVIANHAMTSGVEVPSDLMRAPCFGFNQSGGQCIGLSQEAEGH